MTNKTNITIIVLIILTVGFIVYLQTKSPVTPISDTDTTSEGTEVRNDDDTKEEIKNFSFACSDKTQGTVRYDIPNDTVTVKLGADTYNLVLARSASGSRYTNEDESFVFWEKGGNAFIEKRGEIIHEDCIFSPQI